MQDGIESANQGDTGANRSGGSEIIEQGNGVDEDLVRQSL